MERDKEFLHYIKDTGYDDLLDFDEKTVIKYKNTLHYQKWLLEKSYKEFAKALRETKFGVAIIWIVEFLNKYIMMKFFKGGKK